MKKNNVLKLALLTLFILAFYSCSSRKKKGCDCPSFGYVSFLDSEKKMG